MVMKCKLGAEASRFPGKKSFLTFERRGKLKLKILKLVRDSEKREEKMIIKKAEKRKKEKLQ